MRDSNTTGEVSLVRNRLVELLPFEERSAFAGHCTMMMLEAGRIIAEPNQSIQYVYFPYTASISVSAIDGNSRCIEGMLIGNEGMFGLPLVLGADTWPLRAHAQCNGQSLRMPADDFRCLYAGSPLLRQMLMRYSLVTLAQLARSIVCTSFHSIESRLARWLLMTQDRTCSNTFYITHELLSEVLGVRRAGVSVAAASLKEQALIRYRNGNVTVLDRDGLRNASCDCYDAGCEVYRANLQSPPADFRTLN